MFFKKGKQEMANKLKFEKKVTVVSMLCENNSIRAIERMTGVHRDTIMSSEVDYGKVIKTFTHSDLEAQRRYSPPDVVHIKKSKVQGDPDMDLCSTSYIEKQNHTVRMHCRRLSRLTNAFSKKRENFDAAIALHYAYYNLCKKHLTIKCTPAMEAGITDSKWSVEELVTKAEL